MIDYSQLIEYCDEHEISSAELAARIGCGNSFLIDLRRGKDVRFSTLCRFCEAFGLGISDVVKFVKDDGSEPVLKDRKKSLTINRDAMAASFMLKFKDKYGSIPSTTEDYLRFISLAYKQGCKDTITAMEGM